MFDYKYDFSIVMGYYNRKEQLMITLNDFNNKYKDYSYEVIIIDDNSSLEHSLNNTDLSNFDFPIIYEKISAEEKGQRINPCVVYNKGFKKTSGKYVFIQNPECAHIGDLLGYIKENPPINEYLAFSCYNITTPLLMPQFKNNTNIVKELFFRQINSQFGPEWYNHPEYRNCHYHFCAVIKNEYLKLLGGFNEEFKYGHSYDDNEILLSIKYNLKINIKTINPDKCFVVHQYHDRDSEKRFTQEEINKKLELNKSIYTNMLKYHLRNKFNFPKLLHLYWDGSLFSYLNLCTILSFNKYHNFWKINIYVPNNPNKVISWQTDEQKEQYVGKDYFNELYNILNVNIHKINFDNIDFEFKDASEVIKSDYFRLYILNKYGGVWSDFDIIYKSSIEDMYSDKSDIISKSNLEYNYNNKNIITYFYKDNLTNNYIIPVGLFISNSNNSFFNCMLNNYSKFYNKDKYQCLGAIMITNIVFNSHFKSIANEINSNEIIIDNAEAYLPIKWYELDKLYNIEHINNNYNCIGIHWFNGAKESKNYANNLEKRYNEKKLLNSCLMDKLIQEYIGTISI